MDITAGHSPRILATGLRYPFGPPYARGAWYDVVVIVWSPVLELLRIAASTQSLQFWMRGLQYLLGSRATFFLGVDDHPQCQNVAACHSQSGVAVYTRALLAQHRHLHDDSSLFIALT